MNATIASQILDEHEFPSKEKPQPSQPKTPANLLSIVLLPIVAGFVGLLPVVYFSLAGLIGWGVLECAILINGSFPLLPEPVRVGLALLPVIPGTLLITALIRPLLSIRKKSISTFAISREDEPLLVSFIHRVADTTGAPRPAVVELDSEPRILAEPRPGFRNSELRLVIGMPLITGLSLQSLGGLLARSLGPFSRFEGMRLIRFVRSINSIFQRSADWPNPLESRIEEIIHPDQTRGEESRDWKTWVVVLSLKSISAVIGLVRNLFRLFAGISRAASAFVLRQLDHEADLCQITFSGSENFDTTLRRLARLESASAFARERITSLLDENRLSRDYPDLVRHLSENLPPDAVATIRETYGRSSSWTEFRPSIKERVHAAYHRDDAGLFSSEKPASSLIRDPDSLGEMVTRQWYRSDWGVDTGRIELVSNEALYRDDENARRQIAEATAFFGDGLDPLRPFFPSRGASGQFSGLPDLSTAEIPEQSAAAVERNRKHLDQFDELVNARRIAVEFHQMALAGYPIDPASADQEDSDPDSLKSVVDFLDQQLLRVSTNLGQFEDHHVLMIAIAVRNLGDCRKKAARIDVWFHHLAVVEQIYSAIPALNELTTRLGALVERQPDSDLSAQCGERFEIHMQVCELLKRIEDYLGNLPYPFEDFGDDATMWDYLTADVGIRNEAIAQSGAIANAVIERIGEFYLRVMGQLAIDLNQEPEDENSTLFDRWAKLASL